MKDAYTQAIKLLEEFRKLDPEMPAQTVSIFLRVAREEGISMKELTEKLGLTQAAISRNISALSKIQRPGRSGHDLVYAQEDPTDRRIKIVYLTPKGKRFAQSVKDIMSA